ncbi:MAG: hypothetical protein OXC72_01770 [Roseovarius sp.]|nr:hypothetical protein [Roseovarius sp.]MCY4290473.1 hypothetical protein [Roseovarius sp.]
MEKRAKNRLLRPRKPLKSDPEQNKFVYNFSLLNQRNFPNCKFVYTGSIPVLASTKINDLRHPLSPSLPFLKQALKTSRFRLAPFHLISCFLNSLRQLPLPDPRPAMFFSISTTE